MSVLNWANAILSIIPGRWLTLVQSVPEELLLSKPAPSEWSALDCLQHIVDTERMTMGARVKALLAETSFPGFNPADMGVRPTPTPALAEEFQILRQTNLELLSHVTESDLGKQALHGEYGQVTMSQFLHHWAGHDLMHTVQAERALLQPLIAGCGPWNVNYTDHIFTPHQNV